LIIIYVECAACFGTFPTLSFADRWFCYSLMRKLRAEMHPQSQISPSRSGRGGAALRLRLLPFDHQRRETKFTANARSVFMAMFNNPSEEKLNLKVRNV
jgi:hypothetical protein